MMTGRKIAAMWDNEMQTFYNEITKIYPKCMLFVMNHAF